MAHAITHIVRSTPRPDVANRGDDSVRVIRSDARPRLPPHIGRRCETIREHAQWKDSAHGFDEARE